MIHSNNKWTVMLLAAGLAIVIGGSIASCKHDPVYPQVCFESEILPIFISHCAMTGCHDAATAADDVILTDYENIMNSGIVAGNASGSKIYRSMTGGEELMPPGQRLDDRDISLIRSWIENGAENTVNCSLDTTDCDTTMVTYAGRVAGLFAQHCTTCHNAGATFNFDGYANLAAYLNTNSSKLLDNINYTGAQPMPPTGKMNDCAIRQIELWVGAGFPNN